MKTSKFWIMGIFTTVWMLAGLPAVETSLLGLSSGMSVYAQDSDDYQEDETEEQKLSRAERNRIRILEEYEMTGKTESCVPFRRLRQSLVLDDNRIFFDSTGRKGYISKVSGGCVGLEREQRFAYSSTFGSLCRGEIITVLDGFGRAWGSCSLGDFEEMTKKPKQADE